MNQERRNAGKELEENLESRKQERRKNQKKIWNPGNQEWSEVTLLSWFRGFQINSLCPSLIFLRS
jgi:hypothetical protein